jgi:hypothetical protein
VVDVVSLQFTVMTEKRLFRRHSGYGQIEERMKSFSKGERRKITFKKFKEQTPLMYRAYNWA